MRRGLGRRDALKKTQGWDEKRQEREEKAADPEPSHLDLWQQLILITCDRSTAAVKTHRERERGAVAVISVCQSDEKFQMGVASHFYSKKLYYIILYLISKKSAI